MAGNKWTTLSRNHRRIARAGARRIVDGVPAFHRLRKRTCNMTLIVVALGHRAIPPSVVSRIRSKFSRCFEGVTTGTSIGLLIENTDQRSQDYSAIKDVFRPGHTDYTYEQNTACVIIAAVDVLPPVKTAMRVAAGRCQKYLAEIWHCEIPRLPDPDGRHSTGNQETGLRSRQNPFFCPDPDKSTLDDLMRALKRRRLYWCESPPSLPVAYPPDLASRSLTAWMPTSPVR